MKMSEGNKPENQNKPTNNGKGGDDKGNEVVVTATVDTAQMEELMGRLKEKELEAEKLKKDLEAATGDKDTIQKEFDDVKAEAEDYKNKLTIIGKKKLETKKAAIMEKAKTLIKDEERLKIIADGIKTVEDLKGTEFLIETLETTLTEGKKQHEELEAFDKKKKELGAPDTVKSMDELKEWEKTKKASTDADPTSIPSSGILTLQSQTSDSSEGYDSEAAMIRDLRKRSHDKNPEIAAEAKAILRELFRKWTVAVKKEYEGKMRGGVQVAKGEEQASLRDITLLGGGAREPETKKKTEGD
jgi:chromosome segregation ATPase